MTRSSRLAALLTGAALVAAPSLALAPAAHAAGTVLTPGSGTVFDSDTSVRIEARVEGRSAATELRLVDPTGAARTVDTAGAALTAQSLTHTLDTSCPEYPGTPCSGRRPARNGTWTVQLTGGASDSRTFVLAIPPRVPSGVRAEATGPREVVVTWDRGVEPDLVGYDVVAGDGRVLAPGDTACAGGTCRTVVTYDTDGPSTEAVAVRAARAACPDCDARLTATSGEVAVTRPAPPAAESPRGADPAPGAPGEGGAASPTAGAPAGGSGGTSGSGSTGGTGSTAGGTSGGSAGGTSGGTGGGPAGGDGTPGGTASPGPGSTAPGAPSAPGAGPQGGTGTSGVPAVAVDQAGADAFALTFKAFGPKIGLPKLPPLPAVGVALPAVAEEADGAFDPQLPFEEQVVEERVPTTALGPAQRITRTVSAAVDSERLARGVAGGLVLLLVCAHVRRWLAQAPTDL